jgi:drug/metabolite transporter (DMT)-like permease
MGAVLLLPLAPALRPRRLTAAGGLRLLVLASLGGPAFIVAMNVAVSLAGATITAFVAGLYAVLAAALAIPLLRERVEPSTLAALALALAGTAMLAELQPGSGNAAGVGVGLVAALLFGLFLVLSRKWSGAHGLPGPTIAAGTLGLTGLVAGLLLPTLGQPALAHPPRVDALTGVVWLAVGPGALAAILVVTGMRRIPARRASAFLLLNPPTAALGAWLLLGERLSSVQLVGGLLVLVAIAGASGVSLPRRGGR